MKIRDSGMPEQDAWEGFFDPDEVLDRLAFTDARANVVDIGCGYGTFTLAAAARTHGTVHAFDIEPAMRDVTTSRAASRGLHNVRAIARDCVGTGTGLADASVGYVMLFNVLHARDPQQLLREAHRILEPGGRVAVIHWRHDADTPRGPDLSIRPRPEQCQVWLREAGFRVSGPVVDLPPWHYGLVGTC